MRNALWGAVADFCDWRKNRCNYAVWRWSRWQGFAEDHIQ